MPKDAALLLSAPGSEIFFSAASLWEVAIKFGQGKPDFQFDPQPLRRGLLRTGYTELAIMSEHVMHVCQLPHIHKDPFDRLLIAQATLEGITLLTTDTLIAQYPGPIQKL
jgi:PIN domain nuclease of toxin-antitoxin system